MSVKIVKYFNTKSKILSKIQYLKTEVVLSCDKVYHVSFIVSFLIYTDFSTNVSRFTLSKPYMHQLY